MGFASPAGPTQALRPHPFVGSSVASLRIGVATLQGNFEEHIAITQRALANLELEGDIVRLRTAQDAESVDAAILPGGESTTISKLLVRHGAMDVLRRRITKDEFPVLGTCAGAILLAREGDTQVEKTKTQLLGVMDIEVNRNAFGRQRESFETHLQMEGFDEPVPAVFIRGPAFARVWGRARETARFHDKVVAARQGQLWALAFHPELTPDSRIHEAFLKQVDEGKKR